MSYNPLNIEAKWQNYWEKNQIFKAEIDHNKEKYYILDMFPYPSGQGLHVGHVEGYTATDILARYKRMKGYNALRAIGWDAFGLPAEQYALDTGTHPAETTSKNIANFKRQIKSMGFSYDWDREINTTDPQYYKWTQWIFTLLYKKGLAYQSDALVNWCPTLKTVLSNEEVIDGKSERGGHPVIRRPMRQWMLKITEYADQLLEGLDELDWPDSIKEMQRNWIGKSSGAEVKFEIDQSGESFQVFTTRPDTLFGATYCALAPELPLLEKITTPEKREAVTAYQRQCAGKSDLDRIDLSKEKTGVFTGAYAVNPINQKKLPVWTADYVLPSYGDGAVMAVPGHDQRDFEFAQKYNLEIISIIKDRDVSQEAWIGDGILTGSDFINDLPVEEAKDKMCQWLEKNNKGRRAVNYKLRDWLFSRQRYWGEPFPLYIKEDGEVIPLEDQDLPLTLPEVESYRPSETGESPLAGIREWINITTPAGEPAKRDSNTMPQWAGSCWYYLRFLDPANHSQAWSREAEKYWMPVDIYIGGSEHAVLHLLYARFWHKVLYDEGVVSTREPFKKLVNQGMILGENGVKMSKSLGNVINPDDIIKDYGADALRIYEMFLGPLEKSKPWSRRGMEGIERFLKKVWRLIVDDEGQISLKITDDPATDEQLILLNQTIKKVGDDIENLRFNTAISQLMILSNLLADAQKLNRQLLKNFILLLSPFAPHIGEELWNKVNGYIDIAELNKCPEQERELYRKTQGEPSLAYHPWPEYDDSKLEKTEYNLPVQVNGKLRDNIMIKKGRSREEALDAARASRKVQKHIQDKSIVKVIFIKDKILNIVAR